jgi:TetR/AcrR family transcriptional repressor of nem operon
MRYEKGHKDTTRRRIVEVASRRFRKEGVEAVGVAGVMAEAGLTHGGFYSHFASKEELVQEAVTEALDGTLAELARITTVKGGGLEAVLRAYLSAPHRDKPERGCVAAALAPELARHPTTTRAAFTERLQRIVGLIADQLPSTVTLAARQQAATAIVALMMGTLQLARAEPDTPVSARLLEGGINAALTLARSLGGHGV